MQDASDRDSLSDERREWRRQSPEGSSDGQAVAPEAAHAPEPERAAALEASYHGVELPRADDVAPRWAGCARCESLPDPRTGPGTLHVRVAQPHTLGKVLRWLAGSPWSHEEARGALRVAVPGGALQAVASGLASTLTSAEEREVRVLFQAAGRAPSEIDYFDVEPLPAFRAQLASEWLVELLRGRRMRTVFQPIVAAARADGAAAPTVHGYECLLRGVGDDGGDVPPAAMFPLARAAGLTFQLDLAGRRAAILAAARHQVGTRVFINFTPHAILDARSCLRSTVALVDEVGLRREQVVFEVVETERFEELDHLRRVADYYRERGFRVALDDVGAGYASLNALAALRPDYAKLDMALVRAVHVDPTRAVIARKLLETARELGIASVAEGIETAEECAWATRHGADYLQGYYFARPAAPPPSVADRTTESPSVGAERQPG